MITPTIEKDNSTEVGFFDSVIGFDDNYPVHDLEAFINSQAEKNGWAKYLPKPAYDYQKFFYMEYPWSDWRVDAITTQQWIDVHNAPAKRQLEVFESGITGQGVNELNHFRVEKWWSKYHRLYPGSLLKRAKDYLAKTDYIAKLYGKGSTDNLYLTESTETPDVPYIFRFEVSEVKGHWRQKTYYMTLEPFSAGSKKVKHYYEGNSTQDLEQFFMYLCYTPEGKRISYSEKFNVKMPKMDTSECLSQKTVHIHASMDALDELNSFASTIDAPDISTVTQAELDEWTDGFLADCIDFMDRKGYSYGVIRKGIAYISRPESIITRTDNNVIDRSSNYNFDLDEFMAELRRGKIEKGLLPSDYEEQRQY